LQQQSLQKNSSERRRRKQRMKEELTNVRFGVFSCDRRQRRVDRTSSATA
jgi:hypothetical protein